MEEKIKSKRNIVITLLWIIIIMRLAFVLLTWSLISLVGLVIPIILFYWVKKKTTKGYETARIWATVFFLLILYGGYKSIETMDIASMIFNILYLCLMGAVALLINSICKISEPKTGNNI